MDFLTDLLIFAAANALLWRSCGNVLVITGNWGGGAEKAIKTAVLYLYCILVITYILGFFVRQYHLLGVAAVVALFFLGSLAALKFARHGVDRPAGGNGFAAGVKRVAGDMNKAQKAALFVFAAALLCKCLSVILLSVYDFDGLRYHLPNLVDYIQNERFYITNGVIWSNAYPKNFEMFNMWMLLFLRSGFLIKLPQFLVALLGGCACYEIFKMMGFSRKNACIGMAAVVSTPVIMAQMSTVYVDAALASFIYISIYFILKYKAERRRGDLLFLGAALGVLAGIKFTGAAYAAVLGVWLFVSVWKNQGFGRAAFDALKTAPLVAAGCAWYFWNWLQFGNPMFPFGLTLGKTVIFDGIELTSAIMTPNTPGLLLGKPVIAQILLSWCGGFPTDIRGLFHTFTYDSRLGGLGFLWLAAFLLAVFMLVAILRKGLLNRTAISFENRITENCIAEVIFVIAVMFLLTPEKWWARYTAFIALVGVMGLLYFAEEAFSEKNFFGKAEKPFFKKIRKIISGLACAVIIVNCVCGLINDVYYFSLFGEKSVQNPQNTFFSNQLFEEYDAWLFDHIGEAPCSIVSFRPDNVGFKLYGPKTENKFLWYTYEETGAEALDNVIMVASNAHFEEILQRGKPDYILISEPYFVFPMNLYKALYDDYVLLAEKGNEKIYKRLRG